MSCRATRATRLSITARASAAEKARFATLAHAAGISESRLALMAIRAFVDEDGRTQGPPAHDPTAERVRATDRITIRKCPNRHQRKSRLGYRSEEHTSELQSRRDLV